MVRRLRVSIANVLDGHREPSFKVRAESLGVARRFAPTSAAALLHGFKPE
jgi:hypothetical protein